MCIVKMKRKELRRKALKEILKKRKEDKKRRLKNRGKVCCRCVVGYKLRAMYFDLLVENYAASTSSVSSGKPGYELYAFQEGELF